MVNWVVPSALPSAVAVPRALCAVLGFSLLSCSGSGNFEEGGFEVAVVDIGTLFSHPMWLEVTPRGSFRGAQTGDTQTCSGVLTVAEHRDLSEALDANFPPSPPHSHRIDVPLLRFDGTFLRGPMAGETFSFDVEPFVGSTERRLWDAVLAPLIRSEETGGCALPP